MRHKSRIQVFLVIVLVLSGIISLSAQDWTQWRESVGAGGASPLLVGDRLYLFTRNK